MNQTTNTPSKRIRGIKIDNDNLQLKLHWNSLYIHASIIMNGLNNIPHISYTHLLIDSGATQNFVNTDTIIQLGIPVKTLENPIQVTLIDGKRSTEGKI
jgi:NADH dehydrogenase FAD-containing subunit